MFLALLGAAMLPGALAEGQGTVLLDQIGPSNASAIIPGILPQNQDFANDSSIFTDTIVIESFSNPDGLPIGRVQTIVGGTGGYGSLDGIMGMHLMVFTSPQSAETGDIDALLLDVVIEGSPTGDPTWPLAGSMDLVTLSGEPWPCPAGDHWMAITPINEFINNGVTGQGLSTIGDGSCMQVNPSGTGGWTLRSIGLDAAITIVAGPCTVALPTDCPSDVSGNDGIVNVDDLLLVVSAFGTVGDGLTRPTGDCAPLPYGDCLVGVDDLLAVIGTFDADCRPRGACCLGLEGCTQNVVEDDCIGANGTWLGEGTFCDACVVGACCRVDLTCEEVPDSQCTEAGETFHGQGIACDDIECVEVIGACCIDLVTCQVMPIGQCDGFNGIFMGLGSTCEPGLCVAVNDTCEMAATATLGPNPFDTSQANDSGFGDPIEAMCPDTYLNWNNSRDVWFHYVAQDDALLNISTCDATSFDTSLVVYRGTSCNNLKQVACNGDGEGEQDCQFYWSRISDLPVYVGDELWIRIGGYEGAGGPGTLTLSAGGNTQPGACCVNGTCIGELLQVHCVIKGGHWVGPWPCDDILCGGPTGPCTGSNGADPVHPDLDWIAGTSDTNAGIARAQSISADTISAIRVYGLAMQFDDAWLSCDDPDFTFDVRTWTDDGAGRPGTLLVDALGLQPSGPVASTVYPTTFGFVTLLAWDLTIDAGQGPHEWLSVQSNSTEKTPCMFLWMSSTQEGEGVSLINNGNGWTVETFGLNYCIAE
jgi:hypothetical protein